MKSINILPTILASVVLFLSGCGDAGPVMFPVQGNVTWNKMPLENGNITFEPTDTAKAPSGGKIVNGRYQLRASAGKCKIRILATRPGKTVDAQMGVAPQEQYIPAKYNSETTLEFEVQAAGPNVKDFDLEM